MSKPIARGYLRRNRKEALVGFDSDTFDTIRKMAEDNRVSFAEMVRCLVEWGMETLE